MKLIEFKRFKYYQVLFFVIINIFYNNCFAKDLYVSNSGSDSVSYANNSISNPWATPKKAWYEARAGDTVYFRDGTYTIASEIDTKFVGHDGTEQNPITFTNYQDEDVLFDCLVRGSPCFDIERTWNVVDGINFNGGWTTFRLGYDSLADHFTVKNCEAHLSNSEDNNGFVYINNYNPRNRANYATIQNCIIVGPGPPYSNRNMAGIIAFKAEGLKILNNEISNVVIGIYYKHANTGTDPGIEIAYNYIHDTDYKSIFSNSNYAYIHDNLIGRNTGKFKLNEANGFPGGDHNIVTHNTIYDVDLNLDSDSGGADYNTFENNIIYSYTIESGCNGNTWDSNLFAADSGIGTNAITGSPIFVGGRSPSTIAGFALAPQSLGKNKSNDGKDMGADVSSVGVQDGQTINKPSKPRGLKVVHD